MAIRTSVLMTKHFFVNFAVFKWLHVSKNLPD